MTDKTSTAPVMSLREDSELSLTHVLGVLNSIDNLRAVARQDLEYAFSIARRFIRAAPTPDVVGGDVVAAHRFVRIEDGSLGQWNNGDTTAPDVDYPSNGFRLERAYKATPRVQGDAEPDAQLCQWYGVSTWAGLVSAQEEHVLKLQDAARRNVKPWEDTFPPTMLPKYLRDTGLIDADQVSAYEVTAPSIGYWTVVKKRLQADSIAEDHRAAGVTDTAIVRLYAAQPKGDYPECSGDSSSCPENEGYGCCGAQPKGDAACAFGAPEDGAVQRSIREGFRPAFDKPETAAEVLAVLDACSNPLVLTFDHRKSKHCADAIRSLVASYGRLSGLQIPAEQTRGDGVLDLLQRGFITSQSYGPDKDYKLVIKFQSLAELQAAHRVVTAAPRQAVPDGWQLVPVEPTREMREAALQHTGAVNATWRDMLAAAPSAGRMGVDRG